MPSAPPAVFQPPIAGGDILRASGPTDDSENPIVFPDMVRRANIGGKESWVDPNNSANEVYWNEFSNRWIIFNDGAEFIRWESLTNSATVTGATNWDSTPPTFGELSFEVIPGVGIGSPVEVFTPSGSGSSPDMPPAPFTPANESSSPEMPPEVHEQSSIVGFADVPPEVFDADGEPPGNLVIDGDIDGGNAFGGDNQVLDGGNAASSGTGGNANSES